MVLELAPDVQDLMSDRIAVMMEGPTQIAFPNSWQILGLAFQDIRDRGMEGLAWKVYDYEMSGFKLYCSSIRFERQRRTEPAAAPNGGPAAPLDNPNAPGGPPSVS
jgi:hypothetical protein